MPRGGGSFYSSSSAGCVGGGERRGFRGMRTGEGKRAYHYLPLTSREKRILLWQCGPDHSTVVETPNACHAAAARLRQRWRAVLQDATVPSRVHWLHLRSGADGRQLFCPANTISAAATTVSCLYLYPIFACTNASSVIRGRRRLYRGILPAAASLLPLPAFCCCNTILLVYQELRVSVGGAKRLSQSSNAPSNLPLLSAASGDGNWWRVCAGLRWRLPLGDRGWHPSESISSANVPPGVKNICRCGWRGRRVYRYLYLRATAAVGGGGAIVGDRGDGKHGGLYRDGGKCTLCLPPSLEAAAHHVGDGGGGRAAVARLRQARYRARAASLRCGIARRRGRRRPGLLSNVTLVRVNARAAAAARRLLPAALRCFYSSRGGLPRAITSMPCEHGAPTLARRWRTCGAYYPPSCALAAKRAEATKVRELACGGRFGEGALAASRPYCAAAAQARVAVYRVRGGGRQ